MVWEANSWEDFGRRQTTMGQKVGGKQLKDDGVLFISIYIKNKDKDIL